MAGLVDELFGQDPLIQAVALVEQQRDGDAPVLCDIDV
jgi:hypothetical protein